MRYLLLLLCASGCDLVLLDDPIVSSICGPYDPPTEVVFDPTIMQKLSQFSPNGNRAFARTNDVPQPKILALKFDGAQWVRDADFQTNINLLQTNQRLAYAQLSFENHMFAAQPDSSSNLSVFEYQFNDMMKMWVTTDPTPVGQGTQEAVLPGGTLITGATTTNDQYQYHVTTHRPGGETGKPYLEVEVKTQVSNWLSEKVSGRLSTDAINEKQEVSQGALAIGSNGKPTIIYAARDKGTTNDSELFVSEKVSGTFVPGIPLRELSTGEDELEPYTNANCTVLYFRRGDKIFQARAHGR